MVHGKADVKADCEAAAKQVEEWFLVNPRRKVCHTEYWKVRRGHVLEDILAKEKPTQ